MIVTTASMVAYLDLSVTNDQLDALQAGVEAACVKYAGRPFEAATRTWYLDGSGKEWQFLPEPLASAPTSVHVDTSRAFGSSSLLVHGTDYVWRDTSPQRLQHLYSCWTRFLQDVKVVGTVGYASAAMPADVKAVVYRETARAYNHMIERAQQGDDVASQVSINDADETYLVAAADMILSKSARQVLDRYKALMLPL